MKKNIFKIMSKKRKDFDVEEDYLEEVTPYNHFDVL